MDNGKNNVGVSILPCYLSPETDVGQNSAAFAENEEDTGTVVTLSGVHPLTFALPPTPESSLSVGSGHDESAEAFLCDEVIAESVGPCVIPISTNILHCPADLDVSLVIDASQQPDIDTRLSLYRCSPTKHADELTVKLLRKNNSQNQTLFADQITEASRKINCSNNDMHLENENDDQNESRIDNARYDKLEQTDCASVVTPAAESLDTSRIGPVTKLPSKTSNLLKFPPCAICSGKASGSHYGAITCEACKGFFRRYLQNKKEFKCTKGGKCEIISSKKGNCSGCRLKKCLALGMSKELTKLGRYTLTKRTELIRNMKRQEGFEANDPVIEESGVPPAEVGTDASSCNLETDFIMRHLLLNTRSLNMSNGFNDTLVAELVQAMDDLEPYGPNIKTKEQISELHKHHSERYKRKTDLFGKMNSVPRDEYNKLYKEFGIDIDGRMADMKLECEDVEGDLARYCNFAKHIPGFHVLPVKDQSNLLKALMIDFFTVVMSDSYNDELRTFVSKNGHGYHFDEVVDREYSAKFLMLVRDVCCRLQMMDFSREETALIAALTLVATDRCKLQNRVHVEKIQLALTELLQLQIKKEKKHAARGRFAKIIDSLTYMREMSELHIKESNILCKDEVFIQEFPFLVDFIIEED